MFHLGVSIAYVSYKLCLCVGLEKMDRMQDKKGKRKHGVNMDVLRLESTGAQPNTFKNSVEHFPTQLKNNELR